MAQSELQASAITVLRQKKIQPTEHNKGAAIELLKAGYPPSMVTRENIEYVITRFQQCHDAQAIRIELVEQKTSAIALHQREMQIQQDVMRIDIQRVDRDIQDLRNSRNPRSNSSSSSDAGMGLATILGLLVFASIGTLFIFNYAVHNFTRVRFVSPAPPQQQSY